MPQPSGIPNKHRSMQQQERPGGYQEPPGLFKQLPLSSTGHQATLQVASLMQRHSPQRTGTLTGRNRGERKTGYEMHCGGWGNDLHQTQDTVSEVYWKMVSPFYKKKKEKKQEERKRKEKKIMLQLPSSQHTLRKKTQALLHFPICANGQLHPEPRLLRP